MGFNTAVIIHNDHLDRIEDDPNFGRVLRQAIVETAGRPHEKRYYRGFDLLPSRHADFTQFVIIGQNSIRSIFDLTEDEAIAELKLAAAQLGLKIAVRSR